MLIPILLIAFIVVVLPSLVLVGIWAGTKVADFLGLSE